ncbi:MAG: hypothetical protein LBE55_05320 [Clostridiales bacterium]|jgi:hypothetical protein|nr:hypothetical protein [Clostridiales bacterium]
MVQESKIYEITQMMSDNKVIRGDVNQAASMVKDMLSEKYITPITKAIAAENKKARKNPTREARLLDALKPFMDHKSHTVVDKTIDMLHMMETLRGISAQLPNNAHIPGHMAPLAAASGDASLRGDGVYDVDERCMEHKTAPRLMPIFAIMALAVLAQ